MPAKCMAGHLLDLRFVMADVGQHHIAQAEKQQTENKIGRDTQFDERTQHMVGGAIGISITMIGDAPPDRELMGCLGWGNFVVGHQLVK